MTITMRTMQGQGGHDTGTASRPGERRQGPDWSRHTRVACGVRKFVYANAFSRGVRCAIVKIIVLRCSEFNTMLNSCPAAAGIDCGNSVVRR